MGAGLIRRIAPDVGWLPVSFTNVFFLGRPGGKWTLVDAGFPGSGSEILAAAEAYATVGEISSALEDVFGRHEAEIHSVHGVYGENFPALDEGT